MKASYGALRSEWTIALELLETMEGFIKDFIHQIDEGDYLEKLVDDLLQGRTNPHRATLEISNRLADDFCQLKSNDKSGREIKS